VKSEHESLFTSPGHTSPGKANAIDTTYIKQQLFNKPPEDFDTNHNSSTNMSSFNKYVEDSGLHQGLVHKKQPDSEYTYTEKQQLQHPESHSYADTNEKVVLPSMPTALIASTDIFSLPEPAKDVLLVGNSLTRLLTHLLTHLLTLKNYKKQPSKRNMKLMLLFKKAKRTCKH
jgi:hypothetical protein